MIANSPKDKYQLSVAPMLDYTDRHFRVLMRQITKKALVYTEMIVAQALEHKTGKKLLNFDEVEHPISLQLGGDDPKIMANAAYLADIWGYDEININLGCPSPRARSGNFGACLMTNRDQVSKCIEAIKKQTELPITIKTRTGIDHLDSEEFLKDFIYSLANDGVDRFIIHARKAWLKGLNPKQNRTIPPLEYDKVERIKALRPDLKIELNGGIKSPEDCIKALQKFDGVMVGRAIYDNPLLWKNIDEKIFDENAQQTDIKASTVIKGLIPYTEKHLSENGKLWDIAKHLLNLVHGIPGARNWRRKLSQRGQTAKASIQILEDAIKILEDSGM